METTHRDNMVSSHEGETHNEKIHHVTKKYTVRNIIHGVIFPWILVGVLIMGIVVYFFYQIGISNNRTYPDSHTYHIYHPRDIGYDWYMDNNRYWMDIDNSIGYMQNKRNNLIKEIQNSLPNAHNSRYYQGTKIINNDIFSYSIEVKEKNLSGSIYSTKSGSLDDLIKKIQDLGLIIRKTDNQYSFSGKVDTIQNLLLLLGN